jgi:spore photoproduct lyase
MPIYNKEIRRLNSVKRFVDSHFPHFGVNKKQEITRLCYEISKSQNTNVSSVLRPLDRDYHRLKEWLLRLRYPWSYALVSPRSFYLPKIEFKKTWFANLKKQKFYPTTIFLEKPVYDSFLAVRFRKLFPRARFIRIASLKDYCRRHRRFTIEDYNRRQQTVFIIKERRDFFKRCPCTKGGWGCNYHIFNLGFGCIYECVYCYLQAYTNSPGIILPANLDSFFDAFAPYGKKGMRIGSGEFSDSLALDEITEFSIAIAEFFRKHKDVTFEFKTKSSAVGNLLRIKPSRNIVISWSLNPQRVIDENEFFTASLEQRLCAASRCAEAGYRVAFHFDPLIHFDNWQRHYSSMIELLFSRVDPRQIAWVSLGTFRLNPDLKQVIERRFPLNNILDAEMLLGYDGKLRYPYYLRYNMYKTLIGMLLRHYRRFKLYLCMEEVKMWKDLRLQTPDLRQIF